MASCQDLSHQVNKDDLVEQASQTAETVKDSSSETSQSSKESSQLAMDQGGSLLQQVEKGDLVEQASQNAETKNDSASSLSAMDQAGNFLQQTGEQMKNMAQGAADAVKNKLGMGDNNPSSDH